MHPGRRKLAAILMTDVTGFTTMMERNEETTTQRIKRFLEATSKLVAEFDGRVVSTAGDSVFAEFDSVIDAVRCARELQTTQERENEESDEQLWARTAVHLGDVLVGDGDVFGEGVNIAARLEKLAPPGAIYVSESVYREVRNRLDLPFRDVGLKALKNVSHEVRVYEIPAPRQIRPPAARTVAASWLRRLVAPGFLTLIAVGAVLAFAEPLGISGRGWVQAVGFVIVGRQLGELVAGAKTGGGTIGIGLGLVAAAGSALSGRTTRIVVGILGLAAAASGLRSLLGWKDET